MTSVADRSTTKFREIDFRGRGHAAEVSDDKSIAVRSRGGSKVYAKDDRSAAVVDVRRRGRASYDDIRSRAGYHDYHSSPLVIDRCAGVKSSRWEALLPTREADGSYVIERDSRGRILDVPNSYEIVPYDRDVLWTRETLRTRETARLMGGRHRSHGRGGSDVVAAEAAEIKVKSRNGTVVAEEAVVAGGRSRRGSRSVIAAEEGTIIRSKSRAGTVIAAEEGTVVRARSRRGSGTVVAAEQGTMVAGRSRRGSGTVVAGHEGIVVRSRSRAGTVVAAEEGTVVRAKSRAGTVIAAGGSVIGARSRRGSGTVVAEKIEKVRKGSHGRGTVIEEKIKIRARSPGGDTIVAERDRVIARDRSRGGNEVVVGEVDKIKGRTPGGSVISAREGVIGIAAKSRAGSEVVVEGMEETRSRGRRSGHDSVSVVTEGGVAISYNNLPTAVRHYHSPESVVCRRSRSTSFRAEQVKHHDVTECRHERPGAEATILGQYLVDRPDRSVVEDRTTVVAASAVGGRSRRESRVSGTVVSAERVRADHVSRRGSRRSSHAVEAVEIDRASVRSHDRGSRRERDRSVDERLSHFEVLERRTVVG